SYLEKRKERVGYQVHCCKLLLVTNKHAYVVRAYSKVDQRDLHRACHEGWIGKTRASKRTLLTVQGKHSSRRHGNRRRPPTELRSHEPASCGEASSVLYSFFTLDLLF
ncbi:unnamed protein product, partial [Ectocarpus sp. 12 AP-2014]